MHIQSEKVRRMIFISNLCSISNAMPYCIHKEICKNKNFHQDNEWCWEYEAHCKFNFLIILSTLFSCKEIRQHECDPLVLVKSTCLRSKSSDIGRTEEKTSFIANFLMDFQNLWPLWKLRVCIISTYLLTGLIEIRNSYNLEFLQFGRNKIK